MVPQRPHLRRAHPGDPERRSSAPRRRLRDEDTLAKLPECRSGTGRRGSTGLGARAAAAPCALLPPVHGRPGGDTARGSGVALPSPTRAQANPTSLSPPPGYFYFHPREFVPFRLPSEDWPPGGPQRAPPGARGRV